LNLPKIEIYTDGSCHTQHKIGAWASIILVNREKIVLKGAVQSTTHNRMELQAVLKAIEFVNSRFKFKTLVVYTDSQYVSQIPQRKEKLKANCFLTKKGTPIQNADLVETLICNIETYSLELVKVKAHQHAAEICLNPPVNYNAEVDKLARLLVRETVRRYLQAMI